MKTMRLGDPDTDSVLIIVTVPSYWKTLPVVEIARRFQMQPHLLMFLAAEVKRWAGMSVTDLAALQRFIDDRTGKKWRTKTRIRFMRSGSGSVLVICV